jgi:hypothetical protein
VPGPEFYWVEAPAPGRVAVISRPRGSLWRTTWPPASRGRGRW